MSTDSSNISKTTVYQDDDNIDLLALLLVILRSWKIILLFVLLGFVIGMLYSRTLNPIFEAQALIEVEKKKEQGLSALGGSDIADLISAGDSSIQKEAELINSRMILRPVIDLLHLDIRLEDPEIGILDKIKNNSVNAQVSISEGVALKTADGQVQISQFNVAPEYLNKPFSLVRLNKGNRFVLSNGFDDFKGQLGEAHRFMGLEGFIEIKVNDLPINGHTINITKQQVFTATDNITTDLIVEERGKQTGIMELTLTGTNQQQVTLTLKQIIQSYINNKKLTESEETINTLSFMEKQLPELKQKLENSEAIFNEFRQKYRTIDIGQEAALLVGEKSQIDSQLNELKLKKADLTTYYTEEHPLIVQINEQFEVLNNRKKEIDSKVSALPSMQREFLKLSEDTSINREIYLAMLKSYEQLKIVKAGQVSDVRIIDLPISTYNVVAPNKPLIVILATTVGFMLGMLFSLVRSFFRNVVKHSKRLEKVTGIPVIATIPYFLSRRKLPKNKKVSVRLLNYNDYKSSTYEAMISLRTKLIFSNIEEGKAKQRAKVVLITGESDGVGKSFICANLTEVFAQLDKRILIIDTDLRQGGLHNIFDIERNVGLSDYLIQKNMDPQENIVASSFIHSSNLEYVDLMPKGQNVQNSNSLLSMDKFRLLMLDLGNYYDYIFIDSPSVLTTSDTLIISQYVDSVLLVTRYNYSVEEQLLNAVNKLNKANVSVDGIILNAVKQGAISKYRHVYSS